MPLECLLSTPEGYGNWTGMKSAVAMQSSIMTLHVLVCNARAQSIHHATWINACLALQAIRRIAASLGLGASRAVQLRMLQKPAPPACPACAPVRSQSLFLHISGHVLGMRALMLRNGAPSCSPVHKAGVAVLKGAPVRS